MMAFPLTMNPATATGAQHPRHDRVRAQVLGDAAPGGHEWSTLQWVTAEVARLLHLPVVTPGSEVGYLVPDRTLTLAEAARLGIQDSDDLLGGVVPHAFVGTKIISHGLVNEGATAPAGWQHALGHCMSPVTLPGYSAFSMDDALLAWELLAVDGPVRLKLPEGIGGHGQASVRDAAHLRALLAELAPASLHFAGVVLEREVQHPRTLSVGVVTCGRLEIAYCGIQHTVQDAQGNAVYGGSSLQVVRGGLETLLDAPLTLEQRRAVEQARGYEEAVTLAYPTWFASRRNYDAIIGEDLHGRPCSGILEQSWRVGGATPAELVALAAFAAEPELRAVQAGSVERRTLDPVPDDAQAYYAGVDPVQGPITKYRWLRPGWGDGH